MVDFLKYLNSPIHNVSIDDYGSPNIDDYGLSNMKMTIIFNDGEQSSMIVTALQLLDDNDQDISDFFDNEIYKNKTKLRTEKLERIFNGTKN